jgi:hypothetical protein
MAEAFNANSGLSIEKLETNSLRGEVVCLIANVNSSDAQRSAKCRVPALDPLLTRSRNVAPRNADEA